MPTVEAVAEQFQGRLRVGKMNVEENDQVPFRYNITTLPTLMIFKGGPGLRAARRPHLEGQPRQADRAAARLSVPAPDGLETFTDANWDREVLRSKLPWS